MCVCVCVCVYLCMFLCVCLCLCVAAVVTCERIHSGGQRAQRAKAVRVSGVHQIARFRSRRRSPRR